mmetsp:Transcript_7460/g.19169  ORF Transcript_7460/g.19169 Transcript_7460/m.19169 type:complete len:472 (+) Transcript_7460:384-1799(+)
MFAKRGKGFTFGNGRTPIREYKRTCVRRASGAMSRADTYFGLDFGTSGARGILIDEDEEILFTEKVPYNLTVAEEEFKHGYGDCSSWKAALFTLLDGMPEELRSTVKAICIDGTSSTSLLVDRGNGEVISRPLMYNYSAKQSVVDRVKELAPRGHITASSTSTLCKLFTWLYEDGIKIDDDILLMHQADWLSSLLLGEIHSTTDFNTCLKLGYDPGVESYPQWMKEQNFFRCLPQRIVAPGTPLGLVDAKFGFSEACQVVAGTTDSTAAFLAAGASTPGEAVTSLGSTLVVKVLTSTRIDDAKLGIYSHKLWDGLWLAGGASNTGGIVLKKYFSESELKDLSEQIDVAKPTGLHYYPLVSPGERFPIADPTLKPKLDPKPDSRVVFLQAILEGIGETEALGYQFMQDLGCRPPLKRVITTGGGARNPTWTLIRQNLLKVPVTKAKHVEAAFGSAKLALRARESTGGTRTSS